MVLGGSAVVGAAVVVGATVVVAAAVEGGVEVAGGAAVVVAATAVVVVVVVVVMARVVAGVVTRVVVVSRLGRPTPATASARPALRPEDCAEVVATPPSGGPDFGASGPARAMSADAPTTRSSAGIALGGTCWRSTSGTIAIKATRMNAVWKARRPDNPVRTDPPSCRLLFEPVGPLAVPDPRGRGGPEQAQAFPDQPRRKALAAFSQVAASMSSTGTPRAAATAAPTTGT